MHMRVFSLDFGVSDTIVRSHYTIVVYNSVYWSSISLAYFTERE
jgi:hypothetical protein